MPSRMRRSSAVCSTAEAGAPRDVVLLNAGAALFVAGRAASIREGIALAAAAIDSGAARDDARADGARVSQRRPWHDAPRPTCSRHDRRGDASGSPRCAAEARAAAAARAACGGAHAARRRVRGGAGDARAVECDRRVQAAIAVERRACRSSYDPVAIARRYERGGAAAISVLTEPTFFDGALEHLAAVRAGGRRCRSSARTSSSTSTSSSRRARPAPTRCC